MSNSNPDRIEISGEAARLIDVLARWNGLSHNDVVLTAVTGVDSKEQAPPSATCSQQETPTDQAPWSAEVSVDSRLVEIAEIFGARIKAAARATKIDLQWRPRSDSGFYVSKPNAVAVKPQRRILDLRVSVLGYPDDFSRQSKALLGLKASRPGHCTFKFDGSHEEILEDVLRKAFENRLKRINRK